MVLAPTTVLGSTLPVITAPARVVPQPSLGQSHGYTEVCCIGRGCFGLASVVQDRRGKLCVMKAIDIHSLDRKHQHDAANEVTVLASLKHPYIVSYLESFLENGTLAIVMDYAEGGDVQHRICCARDEQHAFPEPLILRWFTQASLGLKYLHGRQILHRDLKSANLFLTKQEDLRIGDFGISKVLDADDLVDKSMIGTPCYLSPEICTATLYSFSSDVWALGCVLHEFCTLRMPFEASCLLALMRLITDEPAPVLPDSFSADMRQLGSDLLRRDPACRPSCVEIARLPFIQSEIRRMLRDERTGLSRTASWQSSTTQLFGNIVDISDNLAAPCAPVSQRGTEVAALGLPASKRTDHVKSLGARSCTASGAVPLASLAMPLQRPQSKPSGPETTREAAGYLESPRQKRSRSSGPKICPLLMPFAEERGVNQFRPASSTMLPSASTRRRTGSGARLEGRRLLCPTLAAAVDDRDKSRSRRNSPSHARRRA